MNRNKEIYQDKKSGMTIKAITEKYSISLARVYQIVTEEQTEETLQGNELFIRIKEFAPVGYMRIWNILKRSGVTTLEELQRYDTKQIKRMRGCGAKALDVILQVKEMDA